MMCSKCGCNHGRVIISVTFQVDSEALDSCRKVTKNMLKDKTVTLMNVNRKHSQFICDNCHSVTEGI